MRYVGKQLKFTVPGPPMAWARAGRSKSGRSFTPAKQREYMKTVQWVALNAMEVGDRRRLWLLPVEVEVVCFFAPSKSWPKWKVAAALAGSFPHTKKPDSDNLVKLIKDALSGVVYGDDCQVVDQIGRKRFSDVERTEVVVRPLFFLGESLD